MATDEREMRYANMKYDLNGKVAIVTGGAGNTGSAACRMLAANGAKVVVAGRTLETIGKVAEEIKACGGEAIAVVADVRDAKSMDAMVDAAVRAFGGVDVLVNCAGVRGRLEKRSALEDYDDDLWTDVIATEMTGTYHAIKAATRQMVEQNRGGSIVNVGSASGIVPLKYQCAYSAAKAGVFNFTKAVAMEMGPEHIRCNAIASGETLGDELQTLIDADAQNAKDVVSHIPTGDLTKVEELASLICFLASDAAQSITGAIVTVDGAWTSGYSRDF